MIAALRGAVYEALKREEEIHAMYRRFETESKDAALKDFFRRLAEDTKKDSDLMRRLDLHSMVKFGLSLKFDTPKVDIDEKTAKSIKDLAVAKDILKIATDELNADIEYYEHIAAHSLFPEVKRLFRIIADKKLEHKLRIKALGDLLD
jgi:rubrerythrin